MPTNSPEIRMMIIDSTPVKYSSRMISRTRRKLVPELSRVNAKKRDALPRRSRLSVTWWPMLRTLMMEVRLNKLELFAEIFARVLIGDRPVGLAPHKLVHERIFRGAHFGRRAVRNHDAFRQIVHVISLIHISEPTRLLSSSYA